MMTDEQFLAETRPKDMIDIEVSESLATLQKRYPGQRVHIRISLEPNEACEFWAGVEHLKVPTDYHSEYSKSAHEAVEKLVAAVGDHSRHDAMIKRLNELKKEMQELQEQIHPTWIKPMGDNEEARPNEAYGQHVTEP